MPVYEVMVEVAVRCTERIQADSRNDALKQVKARVTQELEERGYSSLEFQDWEVSEVRS